MSDKVILKNLFSFLFLIFLNKVSSAENIYIGVASNFFGPIKIIKEDFENKTSHDIIITSGSSGSLYSQIINGAPLDIFLSGDQKLPKMLENNSKGIAGTRFTYATGQLQLWSNNKNLLHKKFPGVLNSTVIKYIGIGNPKFVPYGFAAKEVLQKLGMFAKLKPKLILGKNINQVFVMGYFGNLDLAFVAKSDVIIKNNEQKGQTWDIPQELYSPIKQDAIMLTSGKKKNGVKDFLNFLTSDYIKNKIRNLGYIVN
jgi:molybdate transport system substrate-binding protein